MPDEPLPQAIAGAQAAAKKFVSFDYTPPGSTGKAERVRLPIEPGRTSVQTVAEWRENRYRQDTSRGEPSGDAVGRLKKWITDDPDGAPVPATWANLPKRIGKDVVRMVAPGSIPQAATDAAIVGATALAPGVGALAGRAGAGEAVQGAARLATRIGMPAAASAATGGSAAEGALAAGIGELATLPSKVGVFAKKFGHLNGPRFDTAVRDEIGPNIASAFRNVFPSLRNELRTLPNVAELVDPAKSTKIVGAMFGDLEDKIARNLADHSFTLSHEAIALARGETEAQMYGGKAVSARYMIDTAKILRAKALSAVQTDANKATLQPKQVADAITNDVLKALESKRPLRGGESLRVMERTGASSLDAKLATQYRDVQKEFSVLKSFTDTVRGNASELFPSTRRGGATIDLPGFNKMLRNNADALSADRFGPVIKVFQGDDAYGTGPLNAQVPAGLRTVRMYLRGGGPVAAGETVPNLPLTKLPSHMEQMLKRKTAAKLRTGVGVAAVPSTSSDTD